MSLYERIGQYRATFYGGGGRTGFIKMTFSAISHKFIMDFSISTFDSLTIELPSLFKTDQFLCFLDLTHRQIINMQLKCTKWHVFSLRIFGTRPLYSVMKIIF